MKALEKWISKLNQQQKLIAAISLPLILFFLNVKIAGVYGENRFGQDMPFNFDDTWWIWLVFTIVLGFLEYKLFEKKGDN